MSVRPSQVLTHRQSAMTGISSLAPGTTLRPRHILTPRPVPRGTSRRPGATDSASRSSMTPATARRKSASSVSLLRLLTSSLSLSGEVVEIERRRQVEVVSMNASSCCVEFIGTV